MEILAFSISDFLDSLPSKPSSFVNFYLQTFSEGVNVGLGGSMAYGERVWGDSMRAEGSVGRLFLPEARKWGLKVRWELGFNRRIPFS